MISPQTYAQYAADPAAFRNSLALDVDGVARHYGDVMDPWQRSDFNDLTPAILQVLDRGDLAHPQLRAYWERGRGHSKTTDIAVVVLNLLTFAPRPLRGYCYAADRDQAALLKDAIHTLVRLNPWIASIIEVQNNQVVNIAKNHPGEGSYLKISTSDVGSSYGILPDFIVCDELTHWSDTAGGSGESLWHSIISSAAKRRNCLLLVIANAGFVDSWQWTIREAIRQDPSWTFSRLDGPQASWITEDRLAEQQRMLPAVAFARLWLNQWSTGGGDALTEADINAAFAPDLQPMTGSQQGYTYVAGVDLGLKRDCSAVVVLAVPKTGRIHLAHNRLWKPTGGQKINISEIEQHILDLDQAFDIATVAFDPWQAEHMAQRLEALTKHRRRSARHRHWTHPWMREIPPTASNLRQQATLTIECFQDHRFQFYPCEPLRLDLLKLRVEEKSYGFRLTSPRDSEGHGDTFSAFALALLAAHDFAGKTPTIAGTAESRSGPKTEIERLYEHEQELADTSDYDYHGQEQWRDIMRQCGRLR